jgi:hypothetical protein
MPRAMRGNPGLLYEIQLLVGFLAMVGGLRLLIRGLRSYLRAGSLSSIGTSQIASISAGLVRLTGVIDAPITIQSFYGFPCIYYRAEPDNEAKRSGDVSDVVEQSIEFDVRDESGRIHVFPRNAQWDVRMDELQPEARLTDGDRVTLVGTAVPFAQINDPADTDWLESDDPVVARDVAAAAAAGELDPDPRQRVGNLGIPGFALGRPERAPGLDPEVPPQALFPSTPTDTAPTIRSAAGVASDTPAATFSPSPETLVIASQPGAQLLIAEGDPSTAAAAGQSEFMTGLVGAVLAISGAVLLALTLEGWLV